MNILEDLPCPSTGFGPVSDADLLSLALAFLDEGKSVTLTASGDSMRPFIRGGVDKVVLEKVAFSSAETSLEKESRAVDPQGSNGGETPPVRRTQASFEADSRTDASQSSCGGAKPKAVRPVRKGDIVLAQLDDGRLVLHRIISVSGSGSSVGKGQTGPEPIDSVPPLSESGGSEPVLPTNSGKSDGERTRILSRGVGRLVLMGDGNLKARETCPPDAVRAVVTRIIKPVRTIGKPRDIDSSLMGGKTRAVEYSSMGGKTRTVESSSMSVKHRIIDPSSAAERLKARIWRLLLPLRPLLLKLL